MELEFHEMEKYLCFGSGSKSSDGTQIRPAERRSKPKQSLKKRKQSQLTFIPLSDPEIELRSARSKNETPEIEYVLPVIEEEQ